MRTRTRIWIAAAALCAGPRAGVAAEPAADTGFQVRITHSATREVVERVLRGARTRLGQPRCRRVLDAFRDAEGGTLSAALGRTGRAPEDYLFDILFYDGTPLARCGMKDVLAVTQPGQIVVFVCAEHFRAASSRDPFLAEAILIHEMLHTLGLGENPPSSREITSRVLSECR